ncbi:Hsp20 family protein [Dactylosporangium roseum]|uniref:Hsp20 family protein n=1 Tax=Dactylosporangium roseum TaxID=47989 RepID=A0ABY5ZCJ3_9ACTN|nr:Hsp20 family protein [Dactylosporangium roseum]UWZ39848.1 Hsp20 family protein [Dactylosporangium roseum]
MPLSRWDPASALARIENEVGNAAQHAHSTSVRTSTDGDDLVITVDGIDPSDVDVRVAGGTLTVRGRSGSNTSDSFDQGGVHFSSSSSSSSSFARSFSLPDGVDQSDVETEPSPTGVTIRIKNAA